MSRNSPKPKFRRQVSGQAIGSPASSSASAGSMQSTSSSMGQANDGSQRFVAAIGVIAALSAAFQAFISYRQWEDGKAGGEKMEAQVALIIKAASAIAKSAELSNTENRLAQENNLKSAKQSLDVSISANRIDQRAWLNFSTYRQEAEPTPEKPTFSTILVNSGKTPALNVRSVTKAGFSMIEISDIDLSEVVGHAEMSVFPGKEYTLEQKVVVPVAEGSIFDLYKNKQTYLYVKGLTCYQDIYGATHWIKNCAWRGSGDPLGYFHFCNIGNAFGTDSNGAVCKALKRTGTGFKPYVPLSLYPPIQQDPFLMPMF